MSFSKLDKFHVDHSYYILLTKVDEDLLVEFPSQKVFGRNKLGFASCYAYKDGKVQYVQSEVTDKISASLECEDYLFRPIVILDVSLKILKWQFSTELLFTSLTNKGSITQLLPPSSDSHKENLMMEVISNIFAQKDVIEDAEKHNIIPDVNIIVNIFAKGGIV